MATPTIETQIWTALRTRMAALVLSPVVPVLWPGEDETLPNGSCFEVSFLPNNTDRLFQKGTDPHRYFGILNIGVLTVPGASYHLTYAQELAGDVAGHFPADLAMYYSDVTVKVMKQPSIGGGFRDEARARWLTPVTVEYECFA